MTMASRIYLAKVNEVPEGQSTVIRLPDGDEIALFHAEGQFFALTNSCPHLGGPLAEGEVDDGRVTCPWHGWQFDLKTGHCMNCPGENAKSYVLLIENGDIFLNN